MVYLSSLSFSYTLCNVDQGNLFLQKNEIDEAIEAYDKAINIGDTRLESTLLSMRSSALLTRAYLWRLV